MWVRVRAGGGRQLPDSQMGAAACGRVCHPTYRGNLGLTLVQWCLGVDTGMLRCASAGQGPECAHACAHCTHCLRLAMASTEPLTGVGATAGVVLASRPLPRARLLSHSRAYEQRAACHVVLRQRHGHAVNHVRDLRACILAQANGADVGVR